MIASARRDVLAVLTELSEAAPDIPLGRLVSNLAMLARGWSQAMPRLDVLVFRRADALFLAALGLSLVPVRVLA